MAITAAKLIVEVDANTGKATTGLGNVEKSMQKLKTAGESMAAFGQKATLGLTLPLVAAGLASVNFASDAEESLNKVNVVFDESADEITEFASTAAVQLGMSSQEAMEAAGTFGNLFTSMEIGVEASAEMSTGLVQLSSDLASFNNIDPTTALEKLRAGMVGEMEPLRTLGVNLSAAAVEAKAFAMGMEKTGEAFTPAQLAMARYELIMEQTKNAQGDFVRTSDGLANSMRTMQAQIKDVGAEFGEVMVPYVQDAVREINNLLVGFQDLDPAMQDAIVAAGGFVAAIGPASMVLGNIGKVASAVGTGVGAVVGAVGASVAAIVAAVLVAMGAVIYFGDKFQDSFDKVESDKIKEATNVWSDFDTSVNKSSVTIGDVTSEYERATQRMKALAPTEWKWSGMDLPTENFGALENAIQNASTSYEEYKQAIEEAAEANGYLIDTNGEIYKDFGGMTELVPGVTMLSEAEYELSVKLLAAAEAAGYNTDVMYGMTVAQQEGYIAAMELSGELQDYVDGPLRGAISQQSRLAGALGQGTDGLEEQGETAEETAERWRAYSEAINGATEAALSAGLAGTLTQEMEEYQRTLEELGPAHDDLLAKLEYLNVEGWIPSAEAVEKYAQELMDKNDGLTESAAMEQAEITLLASHQSQLTEVKEALGENEQAQLAAAEAMRQATAEMIYQQAAAGLDAQASLELARAMGMINEQDYVVASSIQALKLQYDAMDGSIDGVITNTAGFIGSTVQVQQAADDLIAANIPITFESIATALQNLGDTDVDLSGMVTPMMDELGRLDPESEEFATLRANIDALRKGAATGTVTEVEAATTDITTLFADVTTTATTTLTEVQTAFTDADWSGMGKTAGGELTEGFKTSLTSGDKSGVGLYGVTTAAVLEVKRLWTTDPNASWFGVGLALVNGIAEGVRAGKGSLAAAMKEIIAAALAAAQEAADLGSPSKLFAAEVGAPISEGIAMGMLEAASIPTKAAERVIYETAHTVYNQPINITAPITREIDFYDLAITVAGMIKA